MRKPPTINDIAGALGMHKSTVSLALSDKGTLSYDTRQRVKTVARELGYEPNLHAQGLAYGQANATVCLVSVVLGLGLAAEKALLLQKALNAYSHEVPLYTSFDPSGEHGEMQANRMRQICRQRPRAIVCAAQRIHPTVFGELAAFKRSGGIVVTYDTPVPLDCDQVIFDREDNAYGAARYLLEYGHWKIGVGMSDTGAMDNGEPREYIRDPQVHRLRGIRRALAERDLTLRKEWFFRNAAYEQGGAEMARQYLRLKERPTAVAIANDYVAMAFMVEVMRAGIRVPQELSIIGLDNQPIAPYCPVPLTAMTHPVAEIVGAAESLVRQRVDSGHPANDPLRTIVLKSKLVQRASVAVVHDRLY